MSADIPAASPPVRRPILRRLLGWTFVLGMIVAALLLVVYRRQVLHTVLLRLAQRPVGAPEQVIEIEISAGMSAAEIDARLRRTGLDFIPGLFRFAARERRADRDLKPGRYRIRGDMTLLAIADLLRAGESITRSLRIPEGATLREMAALVEQSRIADATTFLAVAATASARIGAATVQNLDGFLFPATYAFSPTADATEVVAELHHKFRQVCQETGLDINQPAVAIRPSQALSPVEIVTLASIVEAEAAVPSERTTIAGVFLNRLAKGMPLQSCATVYAALGYRPVPLLKKHLEIDSPFNTYRVHGLPPRPICNPGQASLKAALAPANHRYLYFVSRGDGTHEFAETLRDHNRAKHRYRGHLKVELNE